MLLLAIDTAHKNGSITLARGEETTLRVLGTLPIEGGAFSAQLVPRVSQLLAQQGLQKTSMDAYIACVGPGSFTGLRIGLAGVKGLCEVLPRPIVAVSSLEALAANSCVSAPARLLALLDAGRGEFYAGEYDRVGSRLVRRSESLRTREETVGMLQPDVSVVASQPAIADWAHSAGARIIRVPEVTSVKIAEVGWPKLLLNETISADALDANYLRRDESLFAR